MKTVFVTGASGGIGGAAARLFGERGYSVAVGYYRNCDAAAELCAELANSGVFAVPVRADLSDYRSAQEAIERILKVFPRVDVLINNAGVDAKGLLMDVTEEAWRKVIDCNLSSAFYCTKFVLPSMLKEGKGSIVNVSSVWGVKGGSCEAAYSAAKAGLIGLTKALAKELKGTVRVNCVAPDITDTKMNDNLTEEEKNAYAAKTKAKRLLTPFEVAEAVFSLAESGKTGKIVRI